MNSEYRSPSPAPPVFRNLNGLHLSDSLDKTASYLARTGYVGPKYEADNYDSDSDDTSDSDCSDMSSSFRGSHDGHPYRPDNEYVPVLLCFFYCQYFFLGFQIRS